MTRKPLILVAAALTMLASACIQKVEYVDESRNILSEDLPIDFSWYSRRQGNVTTKADPDIFVGGGTGTDTHLRSGQQFGVFGYFHPQYKSGGVATAGGWSDGVNQNSPNLFYNEGVSVSESSGNYTYDYANSRFWPRNKLDRISFFAYYPYNPGIADGTPAPGTVVESFLDKAYARQGLVGFYYTVPEKSEDQVDFMISDLCLDQSKAVWTEDNSKGLTGTATGKVKFYFRHALSQIRVKSVEFDSSGNPDVEVTVNYIRFNEVAVFGQCIPVPDYASRDANTGRTPVAATWPSATLSASRPNLTSGVAAKVCYDDSDNFITENVLLMIPHQFFTDATIEVNFDVRRKADSGSGEYYQYTNNRLFAPLTTYSVSGWEPGKIYTYNIKLNLQKIDIDANVEDWIVAGDDVIMDK